MSQHQVILQLTRIEKMLRLQTLLNKEVFTTKEAAIYLGLSRDYICTLVRKGECPAFRPTNGRLYFKREELYHWMLSKGSINCSPLSEAEKMAILNPERG